jgi:hypothetical protein
MARTVRDTNLETRSARLRRMNWLTSIAREARTGVRDFIF